MGADAYLFDIDGTLMRSKGRVHFNAPNQSSSWLLALRAVALRARSLAALESTRALRDDAMHKIEMTRSMIL
jgi:hypothetical protein